LDNISQHTLRRCRLNIAASLVNDRLTSSKQAKSRPSLVRIAGGLLFSSIISLIAYRRRSLKRSGVVGAVVTGTTTFGLGGWSWGLALIFFFVSSSLLSHFREQDKAQTATDKFSKGSERDIGQVAANGGVATLLSLGYGLASSREVRDFLRVGYSGALATANADTWATELGVLSPQLPRLITTGKPVAPGTSGGITPIGTGSATLGAFSLGLVFWLLQRNRKAYAFLPLNALVSGLAGCLFDSLLGATVQATYFCPVCDKETERRVHSCGTPTKLVRGLPWLNNDGVNFLATLFGALAAMGLHGIYGLLSQGIFVACRPQKYPATTNHKKISCEPRSGSQA
jgi:uncharacterized protein (TIGR00297 family)